MRANTSQQTSECFLCWQMHAYRIQKYIIAEGEKGKKKKSFSQNISYVSQRFSVFLRQRCVRWTVVPTALASAVCVTARKAGQDQNVGRGTVTHAASTTESAERASVTATRAGRVNTAPSVSHSDTYSAAHLHRLHRGAQTTEQNSFIGRLKRAMLECECQRELLQ